jgi:hypothetical protein
MRPPTEVDKVDAVDLVAPSEFLLAAIHYVHSIPALAACHCSDDQKWLRPVDHGGRQNGIRRFER